VSGASASPRLGIARASREVVLLGFMPWLPPPLPAIIKVQRWSCLMIDRGTSLQWRVDRAQPSDRYQRTRPTQANYTKTSANGSVPGVARSGLACSRTLAARTARTTAITALPSNRVVSRSRFAAILAWVSRRLVRGVANAATLAP